MSNITAGSIAIQVVLNGKPALMGLDKLTKKMKGLQKPVNVANKMFGKMLKIAGFAGFTKMAIDAGKFGRAMGLLADKTGIAASKISSMRNSFAAMGGSAKSIDNLLNNLSTGIARLSMGDGYMAATLSSMNISAWDNNGRLKKADVLQGEIADWAKQQKDLGRSFAEVAVLLKDNFGIEEDLAKQMYTLGHGGMEAQRKEIEKRTGKLSEETIDKLESLNQKWSEFMVTMQVTFQNTAAVLAPFIEKVLDFAQKIGKFVGDNPEIGAVAAGILALSSSFGVLGAALRGVGGILTTLLAHPLIAAAIGGGYVGKKIGDSETANKIFNDILGPIDLSKRKIIKEAMDLNVKGDLSTDTLGEILKAQGISMAMARAIYSGDIDKWQEMVRKGKMSPGEYQRRINPDIQKTETGMPEPKYIYDENGVLKAISFLETPEINLSVSNTVNKDGTVNTEVTSDGGNVNFTGMLSGSNNSGQGS